MMPELSLNILDVAQNSVTAKATLIEISITGDSTSDLLTIRIADNGCGMTEEQVRNVTDPFFTSRKTRKVGLGIPFFKMAAELTGGSFQIESAVGVGTTTTAVFGLSSIDRMPLGNMADTMRVLVGPNPDIDFVLTMELDGSGFVMDTRSFREVLGPDIPLSEPQVLNYIEEYIHENTEACNLNF
ncbi:MAG: ATP-binding protein [Firmicutes bacterium]|nr:ATP-binding protein [Bacillota bacterium]